MAKEITCPSCGNTGQATLDDTSAFEVRGQFQGKAVRMCKNCGAGLLVGPFSGGFFGKPKVIPHSLSQHMVDMWHREFEVDSERQPIPVSQLAHDLAEMTIESSSSEAISEVLQATMGDEKPSNIDEHMRHEWMILSMFATTYGVHNANIQPDIMESIQDQFHQYIYLAEFSTSDERSTFEQLVRDRYTYYWAILNRQGVNIFEEIGRFFLSQFMQSRDILLIAVVAQLFLVNANSTKTFVEGTSKKFHLTL